MLDLKYWSLGCLVDPPNPPSGHLGPRMSTFNACHGALGGPLFDHFFASILSSILDSFWIRFGPRLGLLLGPFWVPKSGQVGPRSGLASPFFRKCRFFTKYVFSSAGTTFLTQDGPEDRPKIASRRVQDGLGEPFFRYPKSS